MPAETIAGEYYDPTSPAVQARINRRIASSQSSLVGRLWRSDPALRAAATAFDEVLCGVETSILDLEDTCAVAWSLDGGPAYADAYDDPTGWHLFVASLWLQEDRDIADAEMARIAADRENTLA